MSNVLPANRTSLDGTLTESGPTGDATDMKVYKYVSLDKPDEIWRRCIDGCHSRTLRQLLYDHARLASITENEGKTFCPNTKFNFKS